jgi:NAD(P)-dependent dehydrogenase (short-subunit alcohol dehydrogenase family)
MGQEKFRFEHKHAFITGGSNGIGFSIAKLLLKRGASVSFSDIADPTVALKTLNDLVTSEGLPGRVHFTKADVSKFDQVRTFS